jgi:hypothetical protein
MEIVGAAAAGGLKFVQAWFILSIVTVIEIHIYHINFSTTVIHKNAYNSGPNKDKSSMCQPNAHMWSFCLVCYS